MLVLCALAGAAALTTGSAAGATTALDLAGYGAATLRADNLRTEQATNPLGVDAVRPVLSWQLRSPVADQAQTAYQIQVKRADGQVLWDTGQTPSKTQQATYAGPALASQQRYTWQVRVWDPSRARSAWSSQASWEMGLLTSADWSGAQWIGGPAAAGLPRWPTGTQATTSSFHAPGATTYDTANAIDGKPASFWNDDTENVFPDWLTVTTPQPVTLPGVTLYSSTQGGPSDFGVETLDNGNWVTQQRLTGVNQAYTQVKFAAPVTTTAVRITVYADWEQDTRYFWTRIGELSPGLVAESRYATTAAAPLLRTTFAVTKTVRQARLFVSGLAYYQASLNGKRVGDSVLDPAFTMYDRRVNYATHDVTGLIAPGKNALGVELGRGFFGLTTDTPWWNWNKATWNHEPELKAKLVVTYTDGSTATVTTGDGWSTAAGPRVFDSVYNGEDYDARLEQPGWNLPSFEPATAGWQAAPVVDAPKGVLRAQTVQPVKVIDSVPATGVTQPVAGRYVFDFGRTTAGWAALQNVAGPAGTTITMRYGERLNTDGTVRYTDTYGGRTLATDTYVLRGAGSESWQPAFTWQSFRYVEVTGLPAAPTAATMTGHAVHTAVPVVGSFSSSNELYNTIHSAALRTTQNNMQSVLSDTALYEKNGWMDDATLGSQFIPLSLDVQRFFTKWARDMQDAQIASGNVPLIVPSNGNGVDVNFPWGPAPEWQAGYPAVVWSLYQNYGDTQALAEHYDSLIRYADYELGALDSKGLANTSLGDWVAPEATSDKQVTATAYVYLSERTMADIATVLGHDADATKYRNAANSLKSAFNTAFFQPAKGYYQASSESTYRQTSNAYPLVFGLVPAGVEKSVADSLAADVTRHGDHLATGSLGTSVLLTALSRNGHADTAARVVAQTTYPSWGYWLVNGGDTLFESWDLDARSRDHLFLGAAPEQWFYEDLAGLRRTGPAWSTFTVDPAYSTGIGSARATIDTVRGPATSEWSFAADGTATVHVVVPVGSVADIHLPTATAPGVTASGQRLDALCSPPTQAGHACHGSAARDASGIRALSAKDGQLVVTAGSGEYHFVVRKAIR